MTDNYLLDNLVAREMTRRQMLQRLGLTGAAVTLPGFLAACGGGSSTTTTSAAGPIKRGGTFTFARDFEPLTFDPVLASDNGSEWLTFNIFDTLIGTNSAAQSVPTGIATGWKITNGGKTYTFDIRQGVKFSDGTPMTIDDVVWSIQRAADPKQSFLSSVYNAVPYPRSKHIRALDANTLRIDLAFPYSPLIPLMNISIVGSILPKKLFLKDPKAFAQNPVGTGPFIMKEFVKGQYTKLVRNPHYWKPGKPYVDEVMIPFIADDNTRMQALEAGSVDAAADVPYSLINTLDKISGVHVKVEPVAELDAIWLNNKQPPLNDVRVRQALNYATDKEAIVKRVLFGYGEVANAMMPKMQYWRSDIKPYPFDIAMAKKLMKESSVPNGFSMPLVTDSIFLHQQIAQIVKQTWAQIGVNAQIQNLDSGTAFTAFSNGKYWAGNNWYITSDAPAPDEMSEEIFDDRGGTHAFFSFYSNKRTDQILDQAFHTSGSSRANAYGELQQQTMATAPLVPLYFAPARTGLRSSVQGFHTYTASWWPLEEVWINK
jgi:peptide/nickel transport system substrate-binding protein